MQKNFVDTQTGGTSDVPGGVNSSSQKTDLSPKEIGNIRKEAEASEQDPSVNVNLGDNNNSEQRKQAVEEGETLDAENDINAESSTANNILSEYKDDEEAEQDVLSSMYVQNLKENNISEDELVSSEDLKYSTPKTSLTQDYVVDGYGNELPISKPLEYADDSEIKKQFPILPDGSSTYGEFEINKDSSIQQNMNSKSDSPLLSFEGKPIRNSSSLPEEITKGLEGKDAGPKPVSSYYTLKGNRYYKDESGEWFQVGYKTKIRRSGKKIEKEILRKADDITSRALEDNSTFAFNEKNAGENIIKAFKLGEPYKSDKLSDIGKQDVFGRIITEEEVLKRRAEADKEVVFQQQELETATADRFIKFRYGSKETDELKKRMSKEVSRVENKDISKVTPKDIAKYLKEDGEYRLGLKRYAKKDGKWFRVVTDKDTKKDLGPLTKVLDLVGFGNVKLKEIEYEDVARIESKSSAVEKKSIPYLKQSIFSVVDEFEQTVESKVKSFIDFSVKRQAKDLIDNKSFKTEPVFDFLKQITDDLGIEMSEQGYTTEAIERAEMNVSSSFGDILNERVESLRVDFDQSDEYMFMQNPYGLEAAKNNISKTFPRLEDYGLKQSNGMLLSSSDVERYKAFGLLAENNTFKLPKMPGIFFIGGEYATKVDNRDGTQSWFDSDGDPISDSKIRALYESAGGEGQEFIERNGYRDLALITEKAYDKEDVNIKDGEIYKMIFQNQDLYEFFDGGPSRISQDPYFLGLKKAFLSGEDYYGTSQFLMSTTGSSDYSTIDRLDNMSIAFTNKLHEAIEEYNDYKSSEASISFFIQNADDFKNKYSGSDSKSFKKAIDDFSQEGLNIILDKNISVIEKNEAFITLKKNISVWKENFNNANELLNEASNSGMNLDNYLFNEKKRVITSLNNIGNSTSLRRSDELWSLNNELVNLMKYSESIKVKQYGEDAGDASMSGLTDEAKTNAVNQRIASINSRIDEITQGTAADLLNEKAELSARLNNLNKTISFLEDIYYGDYEDEEGVQDLSDSRANIPNNLELTDSQKLQLVMKIKILKETRRRTVSDLENNEAEDNGFFRTDLDKTIESLAQSKETIKPFVVSIPNVGSSKNKFDMLFKLMNDRRLKLEQVLNLGGEDFYSKLSISIDRFKDVSFVGLSPLEKEYYELVYQIRTLTPLYLNNQIVTRKEQNGRWNSFWGGVMSMIYPTTGKAAGEIGLTPAKIFFPGARGMDLLDANLEAPKSTIRGIASLIDEMNKKLPEGDGLQLTREAKETFGELIDYGLSEDKLWSKDFAFHTIGVTTGIIVAFNNAGAIYSRSAKIINGFEKLIMKSPKKAKTIFERGLAAWGNSYSNVMSRNRLTGLIGEGLAAGTQFKSTALLFNEEQMQKELTFGAGFGGGVLAGGFVKGLPFLGRKIRGMSKKEYQALMRRIYGSDASKVRQFLKNSSRAAGYGTNEFMQETGEEMVRAWEDSENGKSWWSIVEERFGTFDKFTKFAVSTWFMGLTMGVATKGGLADSVSNLNEEQFQKYESVKNSIINQHNVAVEVANKSRKESMQSETDAANAIEEISKQEKVDSKTQEEQVDPFVKENNQKKTRKVWNIEFQSDDIVNNLQKRGEDGDFVEGTSESNVLDVFNTLTDEQQQQVRDMSKNANGKTIKPLLVYQYILSLGKDNAQNQSEEVDEAFDIEGDVKAIEDYSNQLNQDVKEAKNLISEEEALSKGLDADINSEIEQTLLAENQGDVSFTSEEGRTLEEEMEQALIEEQIRDYNSLAEENKETLRKKAKEEIEEERSKKSETTKTRTGRKRKVEKTVKKNRKERRESENITELEIEQRAKRIYEEFVEMRSKILLGPDTKEIESERGTLNYNQEESDNKGSIVYDMNDETGKIGQVSGSFNMDGDFVIEEISTDKSSGNYDKEMVSAIASQVDGDIIIPGTSKTGKAIYDDGKAVITKDSNYLVMNTENSPKEDMGRIRPGDRLRNLKIIYESGGITLNAGPGSSVYNAAIEVAAKVLDAGGSAVKAFLSAKKAYKSSKYYKNLTEEKKIDAIINIQNALQETLTSEEFMKVQEATDKSIEAAVKSFQKNSDVYNNSTQKEKAKLTKEFKKNLQDKIEAQVEITEEEAVKGREMLEEVGDKRTKFEDKITIKSKTLELKKKFKNMKEGQKALQNLKKLVTEYANKNLPKGKYSKTELDSMMNLVKNAKNPESLEKAFEKIDALAEKKIGKDLEIARSKTKKRITPQALKKLLASKTRTKGKMDATSVDAIKSFISEMGGMEAVSEMNFEELQQFNDIMDGLVSTGKTDYKAARKFIQDRKRRAQGRAILGFSKLLASQQVSVSNVQDVVDHIMDKRGSFIIIGDKYYSRTDFKENQAEVISDFKKGNLEGYEQMSLDYNAAEGDAKEEILNEFKQDIGSISFKDLGNIEISDVKAYDRRKQDVIEKEKRRKRRYSYNPFTASMDFDGLAVKMWSGGNNELKDLIQTELVNKIPKAFSRTEQDTYDLRQEHIEALNDIFERSSVRKGSEDALRAVVGGQMRTPLLLRSAANVLNENGESINPFNTEDLLSNDNLVHIYNMSKNPNTKNRLIKEQVDVDAIDSYMNSSNKTAVKLKKYADWLMKFYKTRAPEMYSGAYERYSSGRAFEEIKVKNKEGEEVVVDYYPITARVESRSVEQDIDALIERGDYRGLVKAINPSAFQERTNRGGINIMKGASEVFSDYNYQNTRMKHFADVVDAAQTLFGNSNLKDLMIANAGKNTYNKFEESLSDIIKGEATMDAKMPALLSALNSLGVLATLSLKPQQIVKQATSFMHFWGAGIEIGLRGDNPGFIGKNPFAASFGLANAETRAFEKAVLNSAFIRQRWQGAQSLDLEIQRAAESAKKSGSSIFDIMLNAGGGIGVDTANLALLTTRMGDMAGVLFGPGGGLTFAVNLYNKFKKDGMSTEEATQRAIEKFSEVASKTQQSTQVNTLSAVQKQLVFRLGGMYRTSQGAAAKMTMKSINKMFDGTKKNKKEKAQIMNDFIYFGMLSPVLFTAVSTGAVMSVMAAFDLVTPPAIDDDDEDKVFKRHMYDWAMDNVQSLAQGYGYGGIISDHLMNRFRDREYFNSIPVLKMLDRVTGGSVEAFTGGKDRRIEGEEDNALVEIFNFLGAEKNIDQLSDLFDLMMKEEKDWRRILNKAMNWQTRYLQPAFDYGKDDAIFEKMFGEGYLEKVTPVKGQDPALMNTITPVTDKTNQTIKPIQIKRRGY